MKTEPDNTKKRKKRVDPRKDRKKPERKRRLTKKERLIILLPAIAAVIAVALMLRTGRELTSVTLVGEPVQYYGGGTFPIQTGATLRCATEDQTMLVTQSGERELDSLPIYYKDRTAVTLPKDMVACSVLDASYARVDRLSELALDDHGIVTVLNGDKSAVLGAGILYDGKDFYLFLEPVVVEFNNYRFDLPAFSYVEAAYSGDVMVFDYGKKEFLYEAPRGEATATIVSTDTVVSLLGDSMTGADGGRELLFTRPDLLESVC